MSSGRSGLKPSRYNVWIERGDTAYVYNGLSGGLLGLPIQVKRQIDRGSFELNRSVLDNLERGLMLIPDDLDELELLGDHYDATRRDRSRFALTLVTSLGCNLACPYCYEAKHPALMEPDVQRSILDVVDLQLQSVKQFHVTWFGGEPLVGKAALFALSDEFIARSADHAVRYDANIVTNGYLLDERTCTELRERRVTNVQVTINGPQDVHDRMRPRAGGGGSFRQIIDNLHHAVQHFNVSVRVNLDLNNVGRVEELLRILADEGFSGKLSTYPAQIVGVSDGTGRPSSTYGAPCFSSREFATAALQFAEMAASYGLAPIALPRPTGAPCTAVRENELVVGSKGELYKCWMSVGNRLEEIGNIRNYSVLNGRLRKWLDYDPLNDPECRACIALPVCMGGCAHHAMDLPQYENHCGTFRHTYSEQVAAFVDKATATRTPSEKGFIPLATVSRQTSARQSTKRRTE